MKTGRPLDVAQLENVQGGATVRAGATPVEAERLRRNTRVGAVDPLGRLIPDLLDPSLRPPTTAVRPGTQQPQNPAQRAADALRDLTGGQRGDTTPTRRGGSTPRAARASTAENQDDYRGRPATHHITAPTSSTIPLPRPNPLRTQEPQLRYPSDQDADLAWAQRLATSQQARDAVRHYAATGRPLYPSDEDADAAWQNRVNRLTGAPLLTTTPQLRYGTDQDAELAWARQQATTAQTSEAVSHFNATGRPLYGSDQDADAAWQARVDGLTGMPTTTPTPQLRYASDQDADLAWAQQQATMLHTREAVDHFDETGRPMYPSDQDAEAAWQARVDQSLAAPSPAVASPLPYASDQDADYAWAQQQATSQQTQAATDAYASTGAPLYPDDAAADADYERRVQENLAGDPPTAPYVSPSLASDTTSSPSVVAAAPEQALDTSALATDTSALAAESQRTDAETTDATNALA